ncbi:hypothetical protein CONLIGDRAFT_673664 [Coniochaeta ligniaria NRRL 30616]|uniref:DUF7730 domain-containing protein n=1 Tax=Coniochaeta ligniaria NRRL 30616 TaxID=1408157 RepID=A0A1J7IAL3_9PEZI|nr:hypothetical protein CONLIGDRAFT_673664 [Coniochaeta ligniaria NRRL 30616]
MAQPLDPIDLTQDDSDSDSDALGIACGNPHHAIILNAMRKQLHDNQEEIAELEQRIGTRDATIADRQARIADLQTRDAGRVAEITRLEGQVTALRDRLGGRGKRQKRTWPAKLKAYIDNGNRQLPYDVIQTLCCKEENMSTSVNFMHPHILLGVGPNGWKPDDMDALPGQNNATFPYFLALPAEVQAMIFRLWLHKDRPIHCFSRLDPFTVPQSWPVSKSVSGMYNRFYWGEERLLNLTADAVDPQLVLGLLLVSKDFYFKAVHAFYGLNIFVFSSIGEFGRFCKGIGRERAARLQHIELTWAGSQYLTAERTFSPGQRGTAVGSWDSVRTRPFSCFLELQRLRTLAIFVDESNPLYERRKYESPETKAKLLERTTFQPNLRRNRCLRTLQGLDYVYSLRGLDCVRLYDIWAMLRDVNPVPASHPIRDTSFVADVNSAVTMRKSAEEAKSCQLKNLPRLFPPKEGAPPGQVQAGNPMKPWDPSSSAWSIVENFYSDPQSADTNVYDPTRTYYGVHDLNPVVEEDDENPGGAANGNIDRDNNEPRNGANGGGGAGGNRGPDDDSDDDGQDGGGHGDRGHGNGGHGNGGHGNGGHGNGEGGHNESLFVDGDVDEPRQEQRIYHADAAPSHQNQNPHPPPAAFPGPVLQPRSAADLNANAGPSRQIMNPCPLGPMMLPSSAADLNANAGPSRPAGQKRPSEPGGTTNNKRQKQGDVQPFSPQRNATTFEEQTREYLGPLAGCGSIASLLDPFAVNLKRRDWYTVKRVLQRSDARQHRHIFRRLVESEGKLPGNQSSARRITQALLN